jgi:sec-independent protein translocase protein TatB
MFGIDFSEILVIFLIALVVLGPEKLPKLAQTVGRWVGRARTMARQFREQLEQEADAIQKNADLRAHMKEPSRPAYAPGTDPDIGSAHMTPDPPPAAAEAPAPAPASTMPPTESHERGH